MAIRRSNGGAPNLFYPLPRSVMTNQKHLDRELIVPGGSVKGSEGNIK